MKKAANSSSLEHSKFIGKSYQLSKHQVVIEDVIAEGGFSIVFLARSNQNGKKYALKRMYVNNDHDLEACRLEIHIIKKFSETNKNILKYVDSAIQRQTNEIYEILLLTKFCKLGGLVQLMNDRLTQNSRFQETEILKIFCDTCEALADLHALGIIHRDLKVENILIEQEHGIKNPSFSQLNFVLCDFGSATKKIFDKKQHNSSHSIQLVADEIQKYTTLSYRSPEMVDLYSNKLITTKSDIWALGVFLYKLCYFQMPFGESQLAIQEGRYFIPDSKASFYSKQLNQLINFMLDPDPSKRPDIFQVSYLAFQLAQKPCPVKNTNKSEIPNFVNILSPFTEIEWKKASNPQIKKPLSAPIYDTNPSTTVNPRERPKANLNPTNQIIQLSNQNIVKPKPTQTSAKINLSIKPVTPQVSDTAFNVTATNTPQLNSTKGNLGFDDDFGVINTPSVPQIEAKQIEQTPVNEIKKSHRRSASHSSTLFTQFSPQPVHQTQSAVQPQIRLTPTQLSQQLNHQIQQQKLQQQYQAQIMQQQQQTPLSVQTLNRLYTHSRSASASPNIVAFANMNLNQVKAQSIQEEEKKVSNNPFDDNDLFGQEFDRIRHESSNAQDQKPNGNKKSAKKCAIIKYSSIDDNCDETSVPFDPFRKAPLPLFNANVSSSSSSSSSSRCSPNSNVSSETQKQVTIGANSAFQPYKKQPDPFVSAPFEPPTNRKISLSSTSTSSSVTPTALTHVNLNKHNLESLNEIDIKANDEIIQVIEMKDKIVTKTPQSQKNKSKFSANPFIDAPFTVKKTKVPSRRKLSELTKGQESTNSIYDNNRTPTNENKPVNDLSSQQNGTSTKGGISNMSFDDF